MNEIQVACVSQFSSEHFVLFSSQLNILYMKSEESDNLESNLT